MSRCGRASLCFQALHCREKRHLEAKRKSKRVSLHVVSFPFHFLCSVYSQHAGDVVPQRTSNHLFCIFSMVEVNTTCGLVWVTCHFLTSVKPRLSPVPTFALKLCCWVDQSERGRQALFSGEQRRWWPLAGLSVSHTHTLAVRLDPADLFVDLSKCQRPADIL